MRQTKEQQNASIAFEAVTKHERAAYRDKYGTQAHKLPILIRTAGLVAALEFMDTRSNQEGARQLVDDLNKHCAQLNLVKAGESLKVRAMRAPLAEYLHLTREVASIVTWYKRFSVSVLEVEAGHYDE